MKVLNDNYNIAKTYPYTCPHCGSTLELTEDDMNNISYEVCPCCGESLEDDIYLKTFNYDMMEKGCDKKQLSDKEIDDIIQDIKDMMIKDKRANGSLTSPYYYAITGNVGVFIMYDGDNCKNIASNDDYWSVYVFKDYDDAIVKDNL